MDRYKQVHILFLGLVPAGILAGFTYGNLPLDLNVILLALLLIALRAKFFVDDEAYFHDVSNGELPGGMPYILGIVVALVSWTMWVFASFFVKDIERSSILMVLTLIPSTAWIVAAMVKRGAYAEQVPWLLFNILYSSGFYLIYARASSWNPFRESSEAFTSIALGALFLVFLFDFILSRTLENTRIEARKTRQGQASARASRPKKKPAQQTDDRRV